MKQKSDMQQLNIDQIELHLKSAVDTLMPDVFDRIDLNTPQDVSDAGISAASGAAEADGHDNIAVLQRRIRSMAVAAAACLCLIAGGGGAYHYQYLNRQIDSVIGIDVNPSVELSINRKNRVLQAQALNADAEAILSDMDLKGTELNVAVNAVIGSMVTQGYLDNLDNAILVTVSNDSIRKASELRASVVGDIEKTLEENQVQAVVYDQQVIEKDELKVLAEKYGISYGKAYFLQELIEQNQDLTIEDMDELSSMTMEEIAQRITEHSLMLGEFADKVTEPIPEMTAQPETSARGTAIPESETSTAEEETLALTTTAAETTAPATTAADAPAAEETTTDEEQMPVTADRIKIDYVDYEDELIYVYFVTKVKWDNPTVLVRDDEGNSFAAYVEDTDRDECTISVSGLESGRSYIFVLGGLTPREGGNATTVKGYFDTPEIAEELTEEAADEEEDEEDGDSGSGVRAPDAEVVMPATDAAEAETTAEVITETTAEETAEGTQAAETAETAASAAETQPEAADEG